MAVTARRPREDVLQDTHRNRRWPGMWAWALQRLTGLVLVMYLYPHIKTISSIRGGPAEFDRTLAGFEQPIFYWLTIPLWATILIHGLNGIRIIAVDLGEGSRAHRLWLWVMMAAGAVLLVLGSWDLAMLALQ